MASPEQITIAAESAGPSEEPARGRPQDEEIEAARKKALRLLIETRYTPPPLLDPPPTFVM